MEARQDRSVSAYMASTSRGKTINIVIPDDPRALAAYEDGKRHYYAKRGQLNFRVQTAT